MNVLRGRAEISTPERVESMLRELSCLATSVMTSCFDVVHPMLAESDEEPLSTSEGVGNRREVPDAVGRSDAASTPCARRRRHLLGGFRAVRGVLLRTGERAHARDVHCERKAGTKHRPKLRVSRTPSNASGGFRVPFRNRKR